MHNDGIVSGISEVVLRVDRTEHPWEWPGIDYRRPAPEASSLDHLAFEVRPGAPESERTRLEGLGLEVEAVDFPWLEARGLFFRDPERNVVEFLAHQPELGD